MSFLTIIDTLLFQPLQLVFEIIFVVANRIIDNPGVSIIVLSLVMNFLVLPLYKRADAMQEEERDMEKRLHKGVAHIKKTFHGDERMMMLQTYYRQNHYKPTFVLRGAVSLLLEIPFFIAAYRFLSGLRLLNGVSFGPITDLGSPDGVLVLGGMTFNVLPVVMTAVNLISCIIFTKGSTLKSKIQLYAMAVFFLVFLYTSPSGLVFYWTLNNLFSLLKTICYKLKDLSKISGIFQKKISRNLSAAARAGNRKIFLAGGIFLAVLMGILIPSSVIKTSPQEFVNLSYFYHPLWFVVSSFCMAVGIFVIWMGVFYWLAKPSTRYYYDRLVWILSGIAILDYMLFGRNLGILSPSLKYEEGLSFTRREQIWNLVAVMLAAIVLWLICNYWKKLVSEILLVGILAMAVLSVVNMVQINRSVCEVEEHGKPDQEEAKFPLSRKGKNVVVLMLDRAMGEYVPYMFHEKPELQKQFSGFVYYANTVSFGPFTNFGTPPIYGGYEYTPLEMNKRDSEPLAAKHNEALMVMPLLFQQNGYEVTWCNPTYANYQWIPDLSLFDDYPGIRCCITTGSNDKISAEQQVQNNKRNFFCYSILKSVPLCLQRIVYNGGMYNQAEGGAENGGQVITGMFTSSGTNAEFMKQYRALTDLPDLFQISDEETDTFLLMSNDLTHEPMMLQEPGYEPSQYVDNTEYEAENQGRRQADGSMLKMETELQAIHYQTNMAAMLQLGKWFSYLRENDVYDNTRIILVSDHGRDLGHFEEFLMDNGDDISYYYPLLMVKDFGSDGFVTSDEFMTNGDVPVLAMEGIIDEPCNPFTGTKIDSSAKKESVQYIIGSHEYDINVNNGTTFLPSIWYSVHDDMRKKENWKVVGEDVILPLEEK